jgi:bifunctional non-homologous end joining protein LigD
MTPESISLYFCQGPSNKEYHVDLVAKDAGFVVNFRYGRRGGPLTSGSKTSSPVDYAKARSIYDKLVGEKVKKGYSPGETGSAYQATSLEKRFTGVLPQLLNAIEAPELSTFFSDPNYVMQEKKDGKRCLIRRQGSTVEGINRRGLIVTLPQALVDDVLRLACSSVTLDGELVGDVFHAFDILEHNDADMRKQGYGDRYATLNALIDEGNGPVVLVQSAHDKEAKEALFDRIKTAQGEGVVFKDITAPYVPGRPASGGAQLKFKFTASATSGIHD